ncbi:hypothetical protein, conserved [Eimeria acervulina]|uniref:Uncharacterized protein n=1 Tax=Eimeria acervulina TaxID=5801 RepID=U6GNW7_EIMAC|nr:hypothetical protein, conserved [Eimeria acervulina]CDI81911.1 hypothetical protein, conserved [Eimeria acervulina]
MQVSRLPLLSGLNEEYERVDAADAAAAAGPTIISVSRGAAPDSSSSSNNNSSSSSSRAMQVVGRSQGVALYEQPTEPYVAPSLPPLLEQAAAAAAAANAANAANGALQQQTEGPTRACTVPSSPVATTAGAAGEVELKTVIV